MKHSFVLKTIALILCAVSLFGIVASGFGIYVLTEMGLYSKTVPQLREDQIQRDGAALAQTIALRYASTTLGGAPTGLVTQELPSTWNNSGVLSGQYGYVLMDNQGNVLDSLGSAEGDNTTVVRFPVTGQYIHLVSLMTEREKYPSRFTDPEDYTNAVLEGDLYLYEAVPPEGAVLYAIYYRAGDDFSSEVSTGSTIGTAYYLADGFLACLFTDLSLSFPENTTITDVTVVGADGTLLYEASSVNGVGYFTRSGNQFLYVSTIARRDTHAETVPETTAETTPETVPETTAETVPETTPETVPETTEPAVTLDLEDNLPDSGMAEVVEIYAELDNGDEVYHVDEYGVGRVTREEDGTFTFSSYDSWEADTGKVLHIVFLNADGDVLFEASCDEGVGELYLDDNKVCFRSDLPVIPEPTVPETTAETVPPTTAPETVPATEAETEPEATVPDVTEPILINGRPLAEMSVVNAEYYDFDTQQNMHAAYVYIPMPEYTVELYLTDASFTNHQLYYVLELLRSVRTLLLPLLIVSIILTLGSGIYLLIAAGHGKDGIVRAGGLNKTPLDLYLLIIALSIPLFLFYALEGGSYLLRQSFSVAAVCAIGFTFAACLLTVSFLFAAAAQLRTPGGFWWRNTLVAHSFRLLLGLSVALEDFGRNKLFPKISRFSQKLWYVICRVLVWMYRTTEKICIRAGSAFRILFSRIGILLHKFLSLLPLTWQWLLIGFLMFLLIGICITTNGEELLVIMCLCLSVSLIVYGAHCFGTLLDSTKKMRKGNLDTKVDDKLMVGAFKEFAGELNELASVAVVAAQKQLNSERMKSELITNVSHDIKTPLTSIINYVDLLQKPHTELEGMQYLEVLDRQSQQLKKLLEDLMDMSKASTGNMTVEITQVDAVESINQALGEFSDKLERARLTPVFRHTELSVPMWADGRLVWRVLNNLLGNAVKYAMPGTRLYLDLMTLDNTVVISLKNISREELNIDAEELMDRFVRGDGSRNTEGSGLGLNIAKSLMELQKGQMQLLVDGDLFKVTLIFPAAE